MPTLVKTGKRQEVRVPGNSYWIGVNLGEARHKAGLTQKALADKAGISSRTVQFIETDDATNVTVGTLEALGKVLNMDVTDFFKRTEDFISV